jgi:hypothetical protein
MLFVEINGPYVIVIAGTTRRPRPRADDPFTWVKYFLTPTPELHTADLPDADQQIEHNESHPPTPSRPTEFQFIDDSVGGGVAPNWGIENYADSSQAQVHSHPPTTGEFQVFDNTGNDPSWEIKNYKSESHESHPPAPSQPPTSWIIMPAGKHVENPKIPWEEPKAPEPAKEKEKEETKKKQTRRKKKQTGRRKKKTKR